MFQLRKQCDKSGSQRKLNQQRNVVAAESYHNEIAGSQSKTANGRLKACESQWQVEGISCLTTGLVGFSNAFVAKNKLLSEEYIGYVMMPFARNAPTLFHRNVNVYLEFCI